MRQRALTLTFLVILAVALVPAAIAADRPATTETTAQDAHSTTLASLDPTDDAIAASTIDGCSDENLESKSMWWVTEQDCRDYCSSNGWEFTEFWWLGRGAFLCFCCSG